MNASLGFDGVIGVLDRSGCLMERGVAAELEALGFPVNVISNGAQRSEKSKTLAPTFGPLETQRPKGRPYQSSCVMIPNKTP